VHERQVSRKPSDEGELSLRSRGSEVEDLVRAERKRLTCVSLLRKPCSHQEVQDRINLSLSYVGRKGGSERTRSTSEAAQSQDRSVRSSQKLSLKPREKNILQSLKGGRKLFP